ncbi:hypothetical protein BC937DRAFT_92626 [Endogone sp. FLAS-F59071]|nr:hypothetical protein BC937DRAFT_92626 [Endogone sp. FLAS-F59071]|eukprot:RUS21461.1 hypothetical protein BC937DRAFT_92626 [Endogone sp. FLAS-F59071]
MASSSNLISLRNDASSLSYLQRIKRSAELATSKNKDVNKVKQLAKEYLKQSTDSSSTHLSFTATETARGGAGDDDDDGGDDWEMVVSGQKTNTAKNYSDHQIGITIAQCISDMDLLLEALFSPSELLKPMVIKHVARLASDDQLYNLITGATPTPLPTVTIDLLHQSCITHRRVNVLDRLALAKWRGIEAVNSWVHACSANVVRSHLLANIYGNSCNLKFERLVRFHPLTLVELLERDLATTGSPEPTNVPWQESKRPVSYANDKEKQKQVDRVLTDRRDIWTRWRARTGLRTREWIVRATERMLDIMEKWPLAEWDSASEKKGPKEYRRDKVMVFDFYPYLLEGSNLSVFIAHNFERTHNLILRKLSQQYTNNSSFIGAQPWQEAVLKHLSFMQLMTIANDLVLLLAAPLHSGDEAHSYDYHPGDKAHLHDYRRANILAWTTKVFISSLEGRTREQWLVLLRWTSDMLQNQPSNDFDELTFLLKACERLVKLSSTNDKLKICTEAREKRFAKYQKMTEELLELLVPRWSLAVARDRNQQDDDSMHGAVRNQFKKPKDISIFIGHADSLFTALIEMPVLALRFHATAFEVLTRMIQTTTEAEKVLIFGNNMLDNLSSLFNFSKRRERSSITQEDVDAVCYKYLNLAKEHTIDLSMPFLTRVVFVGSEQVGRYVALEAVSIAQWRTYLDNESIQELLCFTLPAAERAALVKSIVMYVEEDGDKNKQVIQSALDALEPLRDLTDPTTQAEMQKKLSTPNVTSRIEAWNVLLKCALLSQSGPALTWALTLLSGSRMNNEPVMHREAILRPLLVVPVANSGVDISKEYILIPCKPSVFQFYNTYSDSLDFHEHARLWFAIFSSVVNARDCPTITRHSLPTIVSNFQEFAWHLVMRYWKESSHPFFTLGLEILWRIKVLEYGEKKAGTEEGLISSITTYISFSQPSARRLWSLVNLREDRFGPQDEPMQQDVELAIVATARALIGFFERNIQGFADESGKARETQLVPLVTKSEFEFEDSRKAWMIVPELTAVVERWVAVLRGAPKGNEGLLAWNESDVYDEPYSHMRTEFEAAMKWYEAKVAKKEDPEMHPLMDEFIALAIRSDQASWAVRWWRTWREVRHGAKLSEIVADLLAISPSAIYLDFVVQYLVDHRQDLLDKYILSGETFLGAFYDSHVAKLNRGLNTQNRASSSRYKRMRGRGGAIFAAQKVARNNSTIEDEDEAIEYILPQTLTGLPRALRLHHHQCIRLGQQVLAIAKNRDATGEERLSGMKRYVHLPTTTYPDLVGLIEKQNKLEVAIVEAGENGSPLPVEKPLPPNIVQELYLGFSHNDEPVAPLEFLLSPAVLKSDQARLAILNLQRVSSYIPASTFHSILRTVLSGERRKVLRVGVHKQIIRLLIDNPSEDNVKLILRECSRRYLHRDVRIELLDGAFKWLTGMNPDEAHAIDAGWKILEKTVAIEDLEPETTAYLLTVNCEYLPLCMYSYRIFMPSESLEIIQNFLGEKHTPSLHLANGELYLTRVLLPLVERAVLQDQQDIVYIGVIALRRFMYSTLHNFLSFNSAPYGKTLATIREQQELRLTRQLPMTVNPELVSRCTAIAVQYLDWVNRTAGLHAEKPEDGTRNWAGVKAVIDWFIAFLPDEQMGRLAYESLHNLISVWCTELMGLKFEDYVKRTSLRDYINYYIDVIPVCIPYTFGTQAEVDLMGLVRRVANPLFDSKLQQREIKQFSHEQQTADEAFAKITSVLKLAAEGRFLDDAQRFCADFIRSFYEAKESTSHETIVGPEFTSLVNLLIQEKLKSTESLPTYTSSITSLLKGAIKSGGTKSLSVLFTCRDGIRDLLVSLGQTKAGFTQVLEILTAFQTFIQNNRNKEGFPERQIGYFQGTNSVVQFLKSVIVSLPEQDIVKKEDMERSWDQHSALMELIDFSQADNILQLLAPSDLSRIINSILQQRTNKGCQAGLRLGIVFKAIQKYHLTTEEEYARVIVDMVNQLLADGFIDDRTLQLITMPIKSVYVANELRDHIDDFEVSLRQPVQTGVSFSSFQIDLATTILEQHPALFILLDPARWLRILVARAQVELQGLDSADRGRKVVDDLTKTLENCLKRLPANYKPHLKVTRARFLLSVAQALYNTALDVASAESGLLKVAGLALIGQLMKQFTTHREERKLIVSSYNALLAQAYTDTNPYVRNIAWTFLV